MKTCWDCKWYKQCEKKPKNKLYPYYMELNCHENRIDGVG